MKISLKVLSVFLILFCLASCAKASKSTELTGETLKSELSAEIDGALLNDVDILIDNIENQVKNSDNMKDFISFIDCPYEEMSGAYGYVLKYSDDIEILISSHSAAESEKIDEVCITVSDYSLTYSVDKNVWNLSQS
ncbi:MAG: hypothetical protein ACI4XH_01955 [Acutalibacteraceae bacterium]